MQVSVVFARESGEVVRKRFDVREGCTVRLAIEQSKILVDCDEINLSAHKVGVFGKRAALDDVLFAGDRVEIYRPLKIDPKQARLLRAKKK